LRFFEKSVKHILENIDSTIIKNSTMYKGTMKKIGFFILLIGATQFASAQCETWVGSPKEGEASDAHTIYRDAYKTKDFDLAFKNWEIAYTLAPAADGKRDYHYTNGVELYKDKLAKAKTAEEKKVAKEWIAKLYDEAIACYEAGAISIKNCNNDDCIRKKVGYLYGRKAYDLYYTVNAKYSQTLEALKAAVENGGMDSEYIIFAPYAAIVVDWFQKEKMTAEEARSAHIKLNEIADHNIAKGGALGPYFQQAKDAMNATFSQIERDIFDCAFFVKKLKPDYDADPDNPEVLKKTLAILKGQGCEPGEPFFDEVDAKWKKYAEEENARIQAEFEKNNPGVAAKKLYDEGDYQGAIDKYQEAIDGEEDPEKQASYLFSMASIQFRKLKQYSTARSTALQAAKLKSGWGRPYMLIGDMYGSSARNCGDDWNQRLAILAAMDKYSYAKSIDPEVAEEANTRISKYRSAMPSQNDGFMRGVNAGQTIKVGCWIGESVKVRYNN
jgi:hypothetical protein